MDKGKNEIFIRDLELTYNELDGEVVMMSLEKGEYYGLNNIGSRIWELLSKPLSIRELAEKLVAEYQVNIDQCIEDIRPFIDELVQKGLVKKMINQ